MKFDRSLLHGMTGLLVLIVLGCASGGQHHRNLHSADEREMTVGTVQREIRKGMDQASVAEALGSPNIVSKDKEGRETWITTKLPRKYPIHLPQVRLEPTTPNPHSRPRQGFGFWGLSLNTENLDGCHQIRRPATRRYFFLPH